MRRDEGKGYNLRGRIVDAAADLFRVIATPISLIGLEVAAIYGIFKPNDAKIFYARIENAIYGKFFLSTNL
jgi:hypothetical protein